MTICPSCARELSPDSPICPGCGAVLLATVPGATGPEQHTSPEVRPALPAGQPRFAPGVVLAGRYRVVAALGKGGMGEVYRADDLKLGQPVALKFLPERLAQDPEWLRRLLHEVRIAREVTHANVCRVHDVGEDRGLHFLTMEYIDGEDLAALLQRIGRFPEEKAVELARQLCVGLAAAHEKGVLHRDLKPKNVMIDGRGKVRLTDFGLAAFAGAVYGGEVGAGTPAYMAPEQRAGREVTVRSDLYALGLVLYEMFTGHKAIGAGGPGASPAAPFGHVSGLSPQLERVILWCLEPEPPRRPPSALAVLASLPGGDPLQAALAAGETPSPQMVADAPVEGSLSPVVGLALLAATLLGIVAVAFLNDRTKLFRLVPLHERPEVLAHKARDLIQRLGYRDPPADSVHGFGEDVGVLVYLRKRDASPARWDRLSTGQPAAMYFWCRQSPARLTQGRSSATPFVDVIPGVVTATEPPLDVPGMVSVLLDLKGRLIEFRAVPPPRAPEEAAPAVDWTALFQSAGLDRTAFREAPPRRHPPVFADRREAWMGVYPDRPEIAIRVEAAACHGRVVFFRIEPADWEEPVGGADFRATGVQPGLVLLSAVLNLTALTVGAWLAWRNWRLGRANLPGALRLAGFLLAALLLSWLFLAHHSFSFNEEFFGLLPPALGRAVLQAGLVWLMYLALEPYVRRRWPWRVVAWNRLLEGRFRDPLVGRDLLLGGLLGVGSVVLQQLLTLAPTWFGGAAQALSGFIIPAAFSNVPGTVCLLLTSVLIAMSGFFMLFVLVAALRREWLAATAYVLLGTTATVLGMMEGFWGTEHLAVTVAFTGLVTALFLVVMLRFGLLTMTVYFFCGVALQYVPLTADFSAWYAGTGAVYALLVAGVAVYGFVVSLGGRPLFPQHSFGDAD